MTTRWHGSKLAMTAIFCSAALVSNGCSPASGSEAPKREYALRIVATSDPNEPLSGVTFSTSTVRLAQSDQSGIADLHLNGSEGSQVLVNVTCPPGFVTPPEPISLTLRTYATGQVPQISASCAPAARTLAVLFSVNGGADLPILLSGRTIGRTDEAGVAHVVLRGAPGDRFELTVSTFDHPGLRPSNPSARFVIGNQDDVATFEKRLSLSKTTTKARSKPRALGPVRIK